MLLFWPLGILSLEFESNNVDLLMCLQFADRGVSIHELPVLLQHGTTAFQYELVDVCLEHGMDMITVWVGRQEALPQQHRTTLVHSNR